MLKGNARRRNGRSKCSPARGALAPGQPKKQIQMLPDGTMNINIYEQFLNEEEYEKGKFLRPNMIKRKVAERVTTLDGLLNEIASIVAFYCWWCRWFYRWLEVAFHMLLLAIKRKNEKIKRNIIDHIQFSPIKEVYDKLKNEEASLSDSEKLN